jgi:Ca2+-binding RTX toxin-like protein
MAIVGLPNVDDDLQGTSGDDNIQGLSGNDRLFGGQGLDTIIGGSGSDVLRGGSGADTFQWSAGHVTGGATDYVADFSLAAGDMVNFLSSIAADVEVLSIVRTLLTETEFNGWDLGNNVATGTDIVFTIRNSATMNEQTIAVLDAWSAGNNQAWEDYLAGMGLAFSD